MVYYIDKLNLGLDALVANHERFGDRPAKRASRVGRQQLVGAYSELNRALLPHR